MPRISNKLRQNAELCDLEARNAFSKNEVTSAMIKCVNGMDPCGVRQAVMLTMR